MNWVTILSEKSSSQTLFGSISKSI